MRKMWLFLFITVISFQSLAVHPKNDPNIQAENTALTAIPPWKALGTDMRSKRMMSNKLGWSYVISGGIGFAGGLAGEDIATDPLEKAVYTVFQTIGIASIGYGLFKVYIPPEDEKLYRLLDSDLSLTDLQREKLFKVYQDQQTENLRKEKTIRAITHGLIAALNFNNASKQKQGTIKDALLFVGGVNLLACVSYSFDF